MNSCLLPHQALLNLFRLGTPECQAFFYDTSLNGIFGTTASQYVPLFLLTCLLEFPVYYFLLKSEWKRLGWQKTLGWILCINLCTHPLVCLGFPSFFGMAELPRGYGLLVSEAFAPLTEGLILWTLAEIPPRRSFVTTLLANLLSWELGGLLLSFLN